MADLAAMRQVMVRMGFTNEGAAAVVNPEGQGVDSIENLRLMTDNDVESLCAVIRRPGGTIADGQGNQVPNRGVNISILAEKKLKLAVYFVKHKKRCSEDVDFAQITLANVQALQSLYDQEKAHKDPEAADGNDLIDKRDWHKSFENLDEYIGKHLGIDGAPLSYLIRSSTAPVAASILFMLLE